MAKYRIYASTYIQPGGRVMVANGKSRDIVVADDYIPSVTWEPLDNIAEQNLEKRKKAVQEERKARRLLKDPKEINLEILNLLGHLKIRQDEIDQLSAVGSVTSQMKDIEKKQETKQSTKKS